MSAYFDLFVFLELASLKPDQKSRLKPVLNRDVSQYLIERFLQTLDSTQQKTFVTKLGSKPTYISLLKLILEFDPAFESKKTIWLTQYKDNFKLQKFASHL